MSTLTPARRRSAETQALKDWTTVRARAALLRVQVFRSDPADGPIVCYFSVFNGATTRHVDLQSLRARPPK